MKKLPSCECLPRKQRIFWSSLLMFLMAAVLAPVVAPAQTITTSGLITNAQEWSGTISLTGDITIGAGGAVTVDAGTTVQAKAGDDTGGGLNRRALRSLWRAAASRLMARATARYSSRPP